MICPGCRKESFNEISVCVSCGTMVNDSVREELFLKITPLNKFITPKKIMKSNPAVKNQSIHPDVKTSIKDVSTKTYHTTDITTKKTSPTLVEFQNKNAPLPDWRLQLQNAVQQRYSRNHNTHQPITQPEAVETVTNYSTNGNAALKIDQSELPTNETPDNLRLKKALERIENSRKKFFITEPEIETTSEPIDKKVNNHNLRIATKTDKPAPFNEELKTSVNFPIKPKLVPSFGETRTSLYDTSELDPEFIPAKISSSFSQPARLKTERIEKTQPTPEIETEKEIVADEIVENEIVVDDYAPFSLRFNAGLFDLIIGSFLSLILLAPFMLLGGNWFTVAGFFAFLATDAIVMFIYQTTTIGIFGKTFGMHLFSLEMIDLEGEDCPTFHQAAVSSSIYLLSVAFLGLGFITSFFDEDSRSIHDIVSNTLVVKEI